MKKKYHLSIPCAEKGCTQLAHLWEFDRRDEYNEYYRKYANTPQFCSRHKDKNEVLTPSHREVIWHDELFCKQPDPERYPRLKDYNTWYRADGSYGSGAIHGEHWQAWAKEFPRGTKIVVDVVARAILPEEVKE